MGVFHHTRTQQISTCFPEFEIKPNKTTILQTEMVSLLLLLCIHRNQLKLVRWFGSQLELSTWARNLKTIALEYFFVGVVPGYCLTGTHLMFFGARICPLAGQLSVYNTKAGTPCYRCVFPAAQQVMKPASVAALIVCFHLLDDIFHFCCFVSGFPRTSR